MLFSFLLAANLARPLGDFLSANWTQFPPEYSYMIGFLTDLRCRRRSRSRWSSRATTSPQPLFERARFADETLGGILGLVQAALLFGIVLVILDSFFANPGIAPDPQELPFLRDLWNALDGSKFAELFRTTLIPAFFVVFGFFVPDSIEANYPRRLSTIDRAVLAAPTGDCRPALLGARLVRDDAAGRRAGRIVEVEAYIGDATTGRRTPALARPPGTGSCSDGRASPTCTLSTGCMTA